MLGQCRRERGYTHILSFRSAVPDSYLPRESQLARTLQLIFIPVLPSFLGLVPTTFHYPFGFTFIDTAALRSLIRYPALNIQGFPGVRATLTYVMRVTLIMLQL